jgi:hypothetical protein
MGNRERSGEEMCIHREISLWFDLAHRHAMHARLNRYQRFQFDVIMTPFVGRARHQALISRQISNANKATTKP